jgi:hypothetical protein
MIAGLMKTPRAAAVAGIIFSLLLIASFSLIWTSIPVDPLSSEQEVIRNSRRLALALDLLPFAGIAFLWFIGVLRDRLGAQEDRLFATVFLGSGLLFLAMVFTGAAVAGGIIQILAADARGMVTSGAYALGRLQVHAVIRTYALKMAGVFMISTATISIRTKIVPRWIALLGYLLALVLLLTGGGTTRWVPLVFPLWVLLVSVHVLLDNLRSTPSADVGAAPPAPAIPPPAPGA